MSDKEKAQTGSPGQIVGRSGITPVIVQNSKIEKLTFIEQAVGPVIIQGGSDHGPSLSPPFGGGGRARLTFYGYDVEFLGREQELEELRSFAQPRIEAKPDFAWWFWSAPGGQGKTRLTAEFCDELRRAGWRCGFLPQSTDYKGWDGWTVSEATFIVIDHVASRAETVRNAICSLSRTTDRISAPLRILMLERPFDATDAWVSQLVPYGSLYDLADFFAFAYANNGLPPQNLAECTRYLTPLPDRDLRAIVTTVATASRSTPHPELDPGSVVTWLEQVDAEKRPLFLVLATRALCDAPQSNLRKWKRQDVVEAVLRRDFHLWQENLGVLCMARLSSERALFEAHLTLVVAATITSRTDCDLVEALRDFGIKVPNQIQPDYLRVITGREPEGNGRMIAPLKPDIVGECFVLERCTGAFGVDATRDFIRIQMSKIFSAALAVAPSQTIDFARRCLADFAGHEGLELFTTIEIPEGDDASLGHLIDYFVRFSVIANMFASAARDDLSELCFTKMIDTSERLSYSRDPELNGMMGKYMARVYYNRGRVRVRKGNKLEARADLECSVHSAERSASAQDDDIGRYQVERIRIEALRLRAVTDSQLQNLTAARQTLDDILADSGATHTEKVEALLVRATVRRDAGDLDGCIADLTAIVAANGDDLGEQQLEARNDLPWLLGIRSVQRSKQGDNLGAIADLDQAHELVQTESPIWSVIRVNRSALHMSAQNFGLAEMDASAVIERPDAPVEQRVKALIHRAQLRFWRRDPNGATADVEAALELAEPSTRDYVLALLVRVHLKWSQHNVEGACTDLNEASKIDELDDDLRRNITLLVSKYGC